MPPPFLITAFPTVRSPDANKLLRYHLIPTRNSGGIPGNSYKSLPTIAIRSAAGTQQLQPLDVD
ncbi:hypothetical protein [Stenomitos frigidus]|uniref:hypothetical protein n=1 Tax=Stenomitos frigidus TaxID=1886765 RepID=UPI0011B1E9CA|nr:hypothetical protein [Stenomitos frigidus]